jgi:VanZ family protein
MGRQDAAMSLTPYRLLTALRFAGLLGGVAALIALTGPFTYSQLGLPFPDTVAHALLFYGLGALMLGALPRSRTSDLAAALVGLGIASEIAQSLVGREMSLHDFAGDLAGATLVFLPVYAGRFRELVRTHPHITFAELSRMNRRQGELNKASRHPLTGP